jgi:hypothetical protein
MRCVMPNVTYYKKKNSTPEEKFFIFWSLTRIDMAYFMHLAVWPPKSSLTPNSEKLCDITVECRGRVGA